MAKQTRFMRPQEVRDAKEEVGSLNTMLADPRAQFEDRGAAIRRKVAMEEQIRTTEPPDTTPAQKDILAKRERDLRTAIKIGMPSYEEMRRSPDGSVSKHQSWEKRNKNRMLLWKNTVLTLNKGTEDQDIANFEQFRPRQSHMGMHSAIIGKDQDAYSFPSEQFKANYDEIDWDAQRALEDASDVTHQAAAPVDRTEEFLEELDAADDLSGLRESLEKEEVERKFEDASDEAVNDGATLPLGLEPEEPASLGLGALADAGKR